MLYSLISTQPKVFRYKKTGFFRKNPVFLKILHLKIYVALLIICNFFILKIRKRHCLFEAEAMIKIFRQDEKNINFLLNRKICRR